MYSSRILKKKGAFSTLFLFLFFSFIFYFYINFLVPIIYSGDGAELASTGYSLGIPHSPGYPIYTEISKLFTFIPLGNIGEKVALLSVFFSVLSLFVLYKTVEILNIDKKAFYFGASLLAVSYTFMGQSLVNKFYTFNLFFVSLLFLIGVYFLKNNYDKRAIYIGSFLLGIITGVHHLGLLIAIPLFIAGLFYFRNFLIDIIKSIPLFILGLLVFVHLPIRSLKDSSFLFTTVTDPKYFIAFVLRKTYEKSTVDAAKGLFSSMDGYINSFFNVSKLLLLNFGWISAFLFLLGAVYLLKKNKKIGIFVILTFIVYSFFLGKLVFDIKNPSNIDWLIIGHQYFIPGLYFYILIVIAGLGWFFEFIKNKNFDFVYKYIPPVLAVFPWIFITDRLFDMNYGTEFVPYSHSKVILGHLPVGSIYISMGDNHTFQGWYLKSISGFRNDICQLKQDRFKTISFTLQGCRPAKLYSKLYPDFFKKGNIHSYSEKDRLYSVTPIFKGSPYEKEYDYGRYIYIFKYFPKNMSGEELKELKKYNLAKQDDIFLNFLDCVSHRIDEPFSKMLCRLISKYYVYLAKEKEPVFSLNELTFNFSVYYGDTLFEEITKVKSGNENFIYLWRIKSVEGFNNPEKFFYLGTEDEN